MQEGNKEDATHAKAETAVASPNFFDIFAYESVLYGLTVTASCVQFLPLRYFWCLVWREDEGAIDWFNARSIGCANFKRVDVYRTMPERVDLGVLLDTRSRS